MRRPIDLTGQRFNRLTAIRPTDKKAGTSRVWVCQCDCGNEALVNSNNLKSGGVKSCGCINIKDLAGQRFGRLTAIKYTDKRVSGSVIWLCHCDCGNECTVASNALQDGNTKSCGCYHHDIITTHGKTNSAEYRSWHSMMQRCYNPRHRRYKDWGGRGIKVCQRWHKFENFLTDMGPRPSPRHSIDRYPNNDGNYEPGNCRWATPPEQAQNRRPSSNTKLTWEQIPEIRALKGKMSGYEVGSKFGVSHTVIYDIWNNEKWKE